MIDERLDRRVWDLMAEKDWEIAIERGEYDLLADAIVDIAKEYAAQCVAALPEVKP